MKTPGNLVLVSIVGLGISFHCCPSYAQACNAGDIEIGRTDTHIICKKMVQRQLDGAPPLPAPSWNCYCEYRFITRLNGRTHPEVLRTPEQQLAFEALQKSDAGDASIKSAADKVYSTLTPEEVVAKLVIKATVEHLLLSAAGGAVAEARYLGDAKKSVEAAIKVLEHLSLANLDREAWFKLPREIRERAEAEMNLKNVMEEAVKAREVWWAANQRAKNVPAIDHVMSKPFTIRFTDRPGGLVAIVTRATDGVTKQLTPIGPVSINGSWDGD
jgi:hypothetical protein